MYCDTICDHCDGMHESEDCLYRPVECDRCGESADRGDLYWVGDMLVGDCCEPEATL